jgi:uncharacterized membrane protein
VGTPRPTPLRHGRIAAMNAGALTLAHVGFGLAAIVLGFVVLLRRKGTPLHRVIGGTYVACILGVNVTALAMHRFIGTVGPFHVFVLVSLLGTGIGFYSAFRKRPPVRWLRNHYYGMCFSYVGLLAATAAEILVRVPYFNAQISGWRLGLLTALATVLITAAGWVLIDRSRERILSSVADRISPSIG